MNKKLINCGLKLLKDSELVHRILDQTIEALIVLNQGKGFKFETKVHY